MQHQFRLLQHEVETRTTPVPDHALGGSSEANGRDTGLGAAGSLHGNRLDPDDLHPYPSPSDTNPGPFWVQKPKLEQFNGHDDI